MDLDKNRKLIAAALAAVGSGDHSALQTVYRLTAAKLFAVCLRILGERSDAEDVPFTVFAPTNDAFAKLPDGTVATLLKPENEQTLTNVLTYHVVPGRLTTKDLRDRIKAGGGKAELKTVQGGTLTIEEKNGKLWVIDSKGDTAEIPSAT